ncbi:tail protein X [Oligoflexus tunisiensis]|uniref:tail protein X n=1 Tax=Oligoflexus tunisiensis TaxID=708132 RepID=UPI00114CE340|nr:tail protein X [Oligoflexus tunisiensis]
MRSVQLKDGDDLDEICWREYGELPGALEAVIAANREILSMVLVDDKGKATPLVDNFGRVSMLTKPEFIVLQDLQRPTEITKSERIFD